MHSKVFMVISVFAVMSWCALGASHTTKRGLPCAQHDGLGSEFGWSDVHMLNIMNIP